MDEFADFVLEMCRLEPEVPKRELWRRVLLNVVFAGLPRPLPDPRVRGVGVERRGAQRGRRRRCLAATLACAAAGWLVPFLLLWVLPVTILLQLATVGRILCEHRFPEAALIAARGREFVCRATAGVFPGTAPPSAGADTLRGSVAWASVVAQHVNRPAVRARLRPRR